MQSDFQTFSVVCRKRPRTFTQLSGTFSSTKKTTKINRALNSISTRGPEKRPQALTFNLFHLDFFQHRLEIFFSQRSSSSLKFSRLELIFSIHSEQQLKEMMTSPALNWFPTGDVAGNTEIPLLTDTTNETDQQYFWSTKLRPTPLTAFAKSLA